MATKKLPKNKKRGKKVFARKPNRTYLKKYTTHNSKDFSTHAIDDFTK